MTRLALDRVAAGVFVPPSNEGGSKALDAPLETRKA
jgi:hypothetical protein